MHPPTSHPRCAEDVLSGHPDRVCDAIAEAVVTTACRNDPDALVGVEVALHRHVVVVTGRIAATDDGGDAIRLDAAVVAGLVAEQFAAAGYTHGWHHPVEVITDLDVGALADDERAIRPYSDDQGIAVGHADPHTTDAMPLEVTLVRRVRRALAAARAAHADVLGPDGKVLVRLGAGEHPPLEHVNLAIQHVPGLGFEDLHRMLAPFLHDVWDDTAALVDRSPLAGGDALRINGIGDFTCGGPLGDNGLSGKKLVVDHYGPHVPIGGGAICGKDPHKPDRVGALRSRQVAVRLAEVHGLAATVHLGWLPGLERPDRLWATLADGRVLGTDDIAASIRLPDLSLAGSAVELELAAHDWPAVMRSGYMGTGHRWDH